MKKRLLCFVLIIMMTGCAPLVGAWAGGTTAALTARYQKTETVAVGVGIGALVGWTILLLTKDEDCDS